MLKRVLTPFLFVLQVFADGSPGGDPVPTYLDSLDLASPAKPSQKSGAESAAGRRLFERDKRLLFHGPLANKRDVGIIESDESKIRGVGAEKLLICP